MQYGMVMLVVACTMGLTLLSFNPLSTCSAAVTVISPGCNPDEIVPKYRNLCLFYNGLLKQQVYDNTPANRFVADPIESNSLNDIMYVPGSENHYTNGGVKRQDVDHVFLRFGRSR